MHQKHVLPVLLVSVILLTIVVHNECKAGESLNIKYAAEARNVRTDTAFRWIRFDDDALGYGGTVEKGDLIAVTNAGRSFKDAEFYLIAGDETELSLSCNQWQTFANDRLVSASIENEEQLDILCEMPDDQLSSLSYVCLETASDKAKALLKRLAGNELVLALGDNVPISIVSECGISPRGLRISSPVENLDTLLEFSKLNLLHLFKFKAETLVTLSSLSNLQELTLWNTTDVGQLNALELPALVRLTFAGKGERADAPEFNFQLPKLNTLRLLGTNVQDMSFLEGACGLTFIEMVSVYGFATFHGLPEMPRLTKLRLEDCGDLFSLDGISNGIVLDKVIFTKCGHLSEITDLDKLKCLTSLIVFDSPLVGKVPIIKTVDDFRMMGCTPLTDLSFLDEMTDLEWLLIECGNVEDYSPLHKLTQLSELGLMGCLYMEDFSFLEKMKRLRTLRIRNNEHFSDDDVKRIPTAVTFLMLQNLSNLKTLNGLPCSKVLGELYCMSCSSLCDYTEIGKMSQLNVLYFSDAVGLETLPCESLKSISTISLHSTSCLDISRLVGCVNLACLNISNPNEMELEQLASLVQLRQLVIFVSKDRKEEELEIAELKAKLVNCLIKVVQRDMN